MALLGLLLGMRHATQPEHVVVLVTISGMLSLGFGLFLGYQISFVDHLFGTTPLWLPH
jgi:hypothetical protein